MAKAARTTERGVQWTSVLVPLVWVACANNTGRLHQPVGYTPIAAETTPAVTAEDTKHADVEQSDRASAVRPPGLFWVCRLPHGRRALRFATNSFALREREVRLLEQTLRCLTHGRLKDRSIVIVGHADPRGTESYNRRLALARANTVRRYLIRHGIAPERIEVASRGEANAMGLGPESWIYDRRVEIWAKARRPSSADNRAAGGY